MPSTIQYALAAEALLNSQAIIGLLFYPGATLRPFLASSIPSLELNSTVTFLARCIGAFIFGLTPQLLLAYPNSEDCEAKRRIVYWNLGFGEAGLIPLFLWEAFRASDEAKRASCLSKKMAVISASILTVVLAWRVLVIGWRPQLLAEGKWESKGRKQK